MPVLARELSRDSGLWRPPDTSNPDADATTIASRIVQASADEEEPSSPVRTLDSPAARGNAASGGQRPRVTQTYMKCLGTTTTTRSCHFQNVYYDLDSKHFIYYGPEGSTPELFGAAVKRTDPWLRFIRYAPGSTSTTSTTR